jgi:hypothetical protein
MQERRKYGNSVEMRRGGLLLPLLSLRALQGVEIQSGSWWALPMVRLDCRVACAPRNDRVWEVFRLDCRVSTILASPFCHCKPFGAWQSSLGRSEVVCACPWFGWIAASLTLLAMTGCGAGGRHRRERQSFRWKRKGFQGTKRRFW